MAGCVLFQAHALHPPIIEAFERLRRELPSNLHARILLDHRTSAPLPPALEPYISAHDGRRFAEWGYATSGPSMLPGHGHFPLLRFAEANPELEPLWFVEHDVRFTGHWSTFFRAFDDVPGDFLCPHLRDQPQEPEWFWWNTLAHPRAPLPWAARTRGLIVVARWSRRALACISEAHRDGWSGHAEVLVPTLLRHHGLSIVDLGGDGPYVPPGLRNRFYTSYSTRNGRLFGLGSIRWRPSRATPGTRPDTLYHPVKPDPGARPVLDALRTVEAVAAHARWRIGDRSR